MITTKDIKKAYEVLQGAKAATTAARADYEAAYEKLRGIPRFTEEGRAARLTALEGVRDALEKAEAAQVTATVAFEGMARVCARQARRAVHASMLENRAAWEGKNATHKRTQKAINSICEKALQGTGLEARAHCYQDATIDIRFAASEAWAMEANAVAREELKHGLEEHYYTWDGHSAHELKCEHYPAWYANGDASVDTMTAADVRRLARGYGRARAKAQQFHDAYAKKAQGISAPYAALGYRDALEKALEVPTYSIHCAK